MQNPITNPVGLDAAIQATALKLEAGLDWLTAFGRAFVFAERTPDGRAINTPKVYASNGEYVNVFPNDNYAGFCFFYPMQAEEYEYAGPAFGTFGSTKRRTVALIFWLNLKRIDSAKDYVYTEVLKREIEKLLQRCPAVERINSYEDENVDKIYAEFELDENARFRAAGTTVTQWLMYPYAGMRFELQMAYKDNC